MKLTSSRPKKPQSAAGTAPKKSAPERAPKRPAKAGRKGKAAIITILSIVAVLLVAIVGGAAYVGTRDTIFPNVYVDGVQLGGMTKEEAEAVLRSSGYEAGADSVRAEIGLPNDTKLVITGEETGMRLDASEAAERAHAIGRDSNVFSSAFKYLAGTLGSITELSAGDIGAPDESVIRAKAQPLVSAINNELGGSTYTVTDTAIELYKGSGGVLASLDDICSLAVETLTNSLLSKTPASAEYLLPEDTSDGGVDFNSLYSSIHREAVSAEYDPETYGVTESVRGVSFDVAIARSMYASAVTGELVRIPLEFTEPDVTSEALSALIFRDTISENTTYIDGTSNRVNNVKLASSYVNGHVLNPGDTFSYNDVVGERTAAKGYLTAGAYAAGRTVQEIGGGICQVSSAIYDCTLYAELEVVERRNHQFTVGYLPLGNDATVNWGTTDYKFKNNTDYPVRIEITTDGRNMTTRFVGTKLTTDTIKIEYTVISTSKFTTMEVEDESVPEGTTRVEDSGSNGCTVETYKYRYDEHGNFIEKEYVARSAYNPHTRIVLVPVGTLTSPEPSPDETPESPDTESPAPSDTPDSPPPSDIPDTPTPPPPEPSDEPVISPPDEPSPPAATPPDDTVSGNI